MESLFTEKKHYRSDARMLASAIKHERISLEQAQPLIRRAIELAEEQAELQGGRYFVALMQPILEFQQRALKVDGVRLSMNAR